MAYYEGRMMRNGAPVTAVYVVLFDITQTNKLRSDTTDSEGYFKFNNLATGQYWLRFHGMGYKRPEDNQLITVVDDLSTVEGAIDRDLKFTSAPSISVSESGGSGLASDTGITHANVTFSFGNLQADEGRVASIAIKYKRTGSSNWENTINIPVATSDINNGSFTYTDTLEMYDSSSSSYDFLINFYSEFNELGTLNDGSAVSNNNPTTVFNGIADIAELVGVENLICINLSDADQDGQNTGASVPQDTVSLQWKTADQHVGSWTGMNGDTGAATSLTLEQLSRVNKYRIYMYVSDDATQPTNMYPGGAESAKWQIIGDTADGQHSVICPRDKYVGFWVGMMDNSTDSSISTSGDTNF